ncbi:hypothetical protein [Natrinema halophilum]|uniref:Uncharacterized protein n=1 Tax=Natrinema halophilum TaxID=1699371 RepID=A0A7D5GHE5_9EURY|nr:hypothetical protein [Natrinema halophilum]QLG49054.1 hypothetical protein HYG82_09435 [Natrinema halophilum]
MSVVRLGFAFRNDSGIRRRDTRYTQTTSEANTASSLTELHRPFAETHEPDHISGRESLGGIFDAGTDAPAGTVTRCSRELRKYDLEAVTVGEPSVESLESDATVLASFDGIVIEVSLSLGGDVNGTAITRNQSF